MKTEILLSPIEFRLLVCVEKKGRTGGKGKDIEASYERCAKQTIPKGTIYTTLQRLGAAQLLTKIKDNDAGDARSRRFTITKAGTAAIRKNRKVYHQLAKFLIRP